MFRLAIVFSLLFTPLLQAAPPEGYIVWSSSRGDGVNRIHRMKTDGSDIVRLVDEESDLPRWSPDGRRILYSTPDALWIMRPDGTGKRKLPHAIDWAEWTADGSGIVGAVVAEGRTTLVRHDLQAGTLTEIARLDRFTQLKGARVSKTALLPGDRWALVMTDRFAAGHTATNGRFRPDGPWAVAMLDLRDASALYYVGGGCQPEAGRADDLLHHVADTGAIYSMRAGDRGRKTHIAATRNDGETRWAYCPKVSTDGKWLAFVAAPKHESWGTGDYDVYIQPLGDQPVAALRILKDPANDRWPDLHIGPLQRGDIDGGGK